MPKLRVVPKWLALGTLAAGVVVAAVLIVRLVHTRSEQASRLTMLESANRSLQARAETLSRQVEALRKGLPLAPRPEAAPRTRGETGAPTEEQEALLNQLHANLDTANASINSMDLRIQELEANLDKMTAENQRLSASETDLKEKLADTNRVLDAVRAELKTKSARLTQVEITNSLLNQQNRSISDKTAQITQLLANLDGINRRRESYLNNILRRYRDITDQYGALSARLDNPHDNVMPPGPELSRIQTSIGMAEEDLRQLSTLNAQAARVQQKIAAR